MPDPAAAPRPERIITVTPESLPEFFKALEGRQFTAVRDPEDSIAVDGNHYTFAGDCEGCLRLRRRVNKLTDAVAELQELFADAVTILKTAGLIEEVNPDA